MSVESQERAAPIEDDQRGLLKSLARWWQLGLAFEDTPEAGEIRSRQMAYFARQTPINSAVTMTISLLAAFALWHVAPHAIVLAWTGLAWAVALWHLHRWWRRRDKPSPKRISIRGPRNVSLWAAVAGGIWGGSVIFFPEVPDTHQLLIIIMTAAMAAGAATTLGAIPTAAVSFLLCSVAPWIGTFVLRGNPDDFVLALMILIFLLAMLGSTRIVYTNFIEGIKVKQANAVLLDQFHAERDEWFAISDTSEAFALFDNQDCLLLWNENYRRILSLPEGSLYRGAPRAGLLRDASPPVEVQEGRRALDEWVDQQLRLPEPPEASVIQQLSNGRWLKSSARTTSRGHTVTLHVDITELIERETALRESEARLKAFLDHSPIGMALKDTASRYVLVNRQFETLYGVTEDAIRGKTSFDLFPPEVADSLLAHDAAVLNSGRAITREEAVPLDDGLHTFLAVKFPILDAGGGIAGIGAVAIDITERKRAEEVLRRQALILEQMSDGVIVTDLDGRIMDWNSAAQRMFGYLKDEVLGKTPAILHRPEEADTLTAKIIEGMSGQGRWAGEITVIRKDGTEGVCETVVVPLLDERGELVATIGVNRDITQRKQAEAALGEREARLRELQAQLFHVSRSAAMGQLSSALAHELNQPLTAIMNYVQAGRRLLEAEGGVGSDKIHDMFDKAIDQANRAGDVIRHLRDLFERGETEVTPQRINQVVEDAAALALVDAVAEEVKYKLNLSEGLPAVMIDRIQIQQVVLNLVRNAVEALAGIERRELLIETSLNGANAVEVAVCDTGLGLTPEVAKRLFQPFVTAKHQGMGVGLSISQRIIEAHGGHLWAEPNPGGGTCFRFTLPVEGHAV